jgi:hypothetical protein
MSAICETSGCENTKRGRDDHCEIHGSQYRTCKEKTCEKWAIGGGYCREHGGHDWRKNCKVDDCTEKVWKGGKCYKHRDKKDPRVIRNDSKKRIARCEYKNCKKNAKSYRYCVIHGRKLGLLCTHLIDGKRKCGRVALVGEKRCKICSQN